MTTTTGRIHAADVENSPRLKRVLDLLLERKDAGATSLEIAQLAFTVAPGTCVSELRKGNGYIINTKREGNVWRYTLTGHIETGPWQKE